MNSKNASIRSAAERLATALAASGDPDPRAALRRGDFQARARPHSAAPPVPVGKAVSAPASPRSFQRAALLFAHHYAAASSAKRQGGGLASPPRTAPNSDDDVMNAVERHEAARRGERVANPLLGARVSRRFEERRAHQSATAASRASPRGSPRASPRIPLFRDARVGSHASGGADQDTLSQLLGAKEATVKRSPRRRRSPPRTSGLPVLPTNPLAGRPGSKAAARARLGARTQPFHSSGQVESPRGAEEATLSWMPEDPVGLAHE
jgi:hypothetical protein